MRPLRRENPRFVSRWCERAGAIWRAYRRLRGLSAASAIAAAKAHNVSHVRSVRRQDRRRHAGGHEPRLRNASEGVFRNSAWSRGRRAGQAHGRNGLSYRWQDAMAARGLHDAADVLSHMRQTRVTARRRRGHCRARSLEALLHHDRRVARLVQRASPSRVEGARRDRERGVGAPDATIVAPRLSRREPRARKRRCPEARARRVHRATLRRDCHGRPRLSRKATPASAGHCETRRQNPRPRAATNRTQSALTFPDAAKRHASLSARSRRTLQQQRSGTRRAHDEAAHENLGRLSIARRRGRLRHNPWISVNGQKTGMEHHRSPAPGPGRSRKEPTRGLIPPREPE